MGVPAIPVSAIWMPTKCCTWNCPGCSKIAYGDQELSEDDLHKVVAIFKRAFTGLNLIILGGDILSWEFGKVSRLVKKLEGLNYSVVTPCIPETHSKIKRLKSLGLKNVVMSSEPLGCGNRNIQKYKFENLLERVLPIKECLSGIELIVDRRNIKFLTSTVKWLLKLGLPVSISSSFSYPSHIYDFGFYDESLNFKVRDYFEVNGVMKELIILKRSGCAIRTSFSYLKDFARNMCTAANYFCTGMIFIVVDTDGSLRPCVPLRGASIKKHNILNWVSEIDFGKIHIDWREDKKNRCRGCYWRHQFDMELIFSNTKFSKELAESKIKTYFGGV